MSWSIARSSRRRFAALAGMAASAVACACGRAGAETTTHGVTGEAPSLKSRALGLGADLLQDKGPVDAIDMYLNGFHFYADDMGRQIEAHHYCSHVNEDFFQCVIYDGNGKGARLIGIEYIVSARLFATLAPDEQALWHSHRHETGSGELVMPGIPEAVETTAMEMLASTYGKTWHTWQIDRHAELPLGIPQLMMGCTADGQLDQGMLAARDRRLGLSSADSRRARAELARTAPAVLPGADAWSDGTTVQLALEERPVRNRRG